MHIVTHIKFCREYVDYERLPLFQWDLLMLVRPRGAEAPGEVLGVMRGELEVPGGAFVRGAAAEHEAGLASSIGTVFYSL